MNYYDDDDKCSTLDDVLKRVISDIADTKAEETANNRSYAELRDEFIEYCRKHKYPFWLTVDSGESNELVLGDNGRQSFSALIFSIAHLYNISDKKVRSSIKIGVKALLKQLIAIDKKERE